MVAIILTMVSYVGNIFAQLSMLALYEQGMDSIINVVSMKRIRMIALPRLKVGHRLFITREIFNIMAYIDSVMPKKKRTRSNEACEVPSDGATISCNSAHYR